MVPILLKALGDPNKFTEPALDKLLSTAFIHYIDGPSLALVLCSLFPLTPDTAHSHPWIEGTKRVHQTKVSKNPRLTGESNRSTRFGDLPQRTPSPATRNP
jgi:hypothetical protein